MLHVFSTPWGDGEYGGDVILLGTGKFKSLRRMSATDTMGS